MFDSYKKLDLFYSKSFSKLHRLRAMNDIDFLIKHIHYLYLSLTYTLSLSLSLCVSLSISLVLSLLFLSLFLYLFFLSLSLSLSHTVSHKPETLINYSNVLLRGNNVLLPQLNKDANINGRQQLLSKQK